MNYIVLDLEWNQPFYAKKMIKNPVVLRGEIIQIGAVKFNEHFQMVDTFKILVKPKYYNRMHKKVTRLTRITTDDLQYGFPFPVAFKHFSKWCGTDCAFLTWGMDDFHMLSSNMNLYQLDTTWIPKVYDVQMIFGDQMEKRRNPISLSNAMKELGESELEAHDALNDAKNTVRICSHLDMKKAFEVYEAIQFRMNMSESYTGKRYASRTEAGEDPDHLCFMHPGCDERIICTNLVRQNGEKWITIGQSETGKEFFVRLKVIKKGENEFWVSRMIYELTEEYQEYYLQKKKQNEERLLMKQLAAGKCT